VVQPANVVVVDDDPAVADSLDILLRASGYAAQTYGSIAAYKASGCDGFAAMLLDVRLPDGDGLTLLQELIGQGLRVPVIIMTGHGDVPMAVKAMRLGASDFIEKPFDPDLLLDSLEVLIADAAQRWNNSFQTHAANGEAAARLERLTARETEVMRKLVLGQANKVIAQDLGLSPRTVEVHRARVMEKTEAGSLSGLVRLAILAGVDPEIGT